MNKYTVLFNRECEVILKKIVTGLYDKLEAFKYIPLAEPEGKGIQTITWRTYNNVGIAAFISSYANANIPTVESYASEQSIPVKKIASSFQFTLTELEVLDRVGESTTKRNEKASLVRTAINTLVDEIAWEGSKKENLRGLVNYPGITEVTLADGAKGSKLWKDKTPLEIAADIISIQDKILLTTRNKEVPNTVLLPPSLYNYLTRQFVDPNMTMSILKHLQEVCPNITTWGSVQYLEDVGAGGKGRIMMYNKSPDKLAFHLPVPYNDVPEFRKDALTFQTVITADVAGLIVTHPLSIGFADGAI